MCLQIVSILKNIMIRFVLSKKKHIIVFNEQGLGDAIQFSKYIIPNSREVVRINNSKHTYM